jgi:hypothetical protein
MFPITPRFVRCVHCKGFFWIEEAGKVGDIPFGHAESMVPTEWQNAPRILWPHIEDYQDALDKGLVKGDPEKEKYIRLHLWWSLNDVLTGRGTPPFKAETIDTQITGKRRQAYRKTFERNLQKLIRILGDSENDLLLKAEALRELGRFEESVRMADSCSPGDAADLIRKKARAKDPEVAELPLM